MDKENTITDTIDNGFVDVQIATIGKVVGSDINGNPVEQNFSEESLKKIADTTKEDVLVDVDHSSEKGGSTEAAGWMTDLRVEEGKGLFGKLKLTDIGKKLIENRVFRFLSPSWLLNKLSKEPETLTSIALTNKPSQIGKIQPIVNSQPIEMNENLTDKEKDILNMNKDDLKALIIETLKELKAEEEKAEVIEEVKEETVETVEVVENKCGDENKEVVENACGETKEEAVAENACVKNECEECKEEEKKEEVIKMEVLNSLPKTTDIDEPKWKSLKGSEFIKLIESGKYK